MGSKPSRMIVLMPSKSGHHQWVSLFLTWCTLRNRCQDMIPRFFIIRWPWTAASSILLPRRSCHPIITSPRFFFKPCKITSGKIGYRGSYSTLLQEVIRDDNSPSLPHPHRPARPHMRLRPTIPQREESLAYLTSRTF